MQRYSRNMLVKEVGVEGQKKLLDTKVLVCGAGGIGSSTLFNLAALGIGYIGIVDSDTVEVSNLNRQYIHKYKNIGKSKATSSKKMLLEFNPHITIQAYSKKLNKNNFEDIVSEYDILVDCFDTFESTLLLNEIAVKTSKILITGGALGFMTDVFTVVPGKTHCLECYFDKDELLSMSQEENGVISPTTSISGALKSLEVIKIVLETGKTLTDAPLFFDGLNSVFIRPSSIEKEEVCSVCGMKKLKFKH